MKRETVLPAPLIFPPPTEARGASPTDALAGLPVPAACLTADAGLSDANREWFQLLEPATAKAQAGSLALMSQPRACCVMRCARRKVSLI
jgi:hypothetical protein